MNCPCSQLRFIPRLVHCSPSFLHTQGTVFLLVSPFLFPPIFSEPSSIQPCSLLSSEQLLLEYIAITLTKFISDHHVPKLSSQFSVLSLVDQQQVIQLIIHFPGNIFSIQAQTTTLLSSAYFFGTFLNYLKSLCL